MSTLEIIAEIDAELDRLYVVRDWHRERAGVHSRPRGVKGLAESILRSESRPMDIYDIATVAINRGMMRGRSRRDIHSTLATAMGRHPEIFSRVGRGTWAIVDP